MCYSLWYNAPKSILAGSMERGGPDFIRVSAFQAADRPQAVTHSLELLRMGKKLLETSFADWNY